MATHTVKTTYALDVETVRTLEDLARRWNVSKSEALRRAIRASSARAPAEGLTPIQALDRLQRSLGLTRAAAGRWAAAARRERRERSRKACSMIHLDAGFLTHALAGGTPQDRRLRAWLAAEEALGMGVPRRLHDCRDGDPRRGSAGHGQPKDFRRFADAGLGLAAD